MVARFPSDLAEALDVGADVGAAGHGRGYLLASSQGDSTFALFDRTGANAYRAGFVVGDGPAADGAQHCDGAAIANVPLGPSFPHGLLVVHDGENTPAEGEEGRENTNFKLVPLERALGATRLQP